eukprot:scaffold584_cov343-Prasinococcus_capsulatus_cf.AAC.3
MQVALEAVAVPEERLEERLNTACEGVRDLRMSGYDGTCVLGGWPFCSPSAHQPTLRSVRAEERRDGDRGVAWGTALHVQWSGSVWRPSGGSSSSCTGRTSRARRGVAAGSSTPRATRTGAPRAWSRGSGSPRVCHASERRTPG